MTPLVIEARLRAPICLPTGDLAIDALLAWAVVQRDGIAPALDASQVQPIEIPIEREPGGRFHLASFADYVVETHERRWLNRRFPVPEAQLMGGPKVRRIDSRAGACKSYRLPLHCAFLVDDRIRWWCLGEPAEIRELLSLVGYLGKRRAVGLGAVERWLVEPCEPWGDGFPVVRDGMPTRPLPLDWPGLSDEAPRAHSTITFPHWDHSREEQCYTPA